MIKTLTGIYFLICIFLFGTFSGNCQESSFDWSNKAGVLFEQGKYTDAAIAFERAKYLDTSGDNLSLYSYRKALCFKQLANYSRAIKELESIFMPILTDSLQEIVVYEKALCHYLNHNPQEALAWLQQLQSQKRNLDREILEILVLAELTSYDLVHEKIRKLISGLESEAIRDSLNNACNELFDKKNIPSPKKEKTAAMLSTFLPGAGQCYAGKSGRGILALILTSGSVGLALAEILNGYYITGYVVGLGLFQKFYFGGIEQSRRLVKERNEKKTNQFNVKVKSLAFSAVDN